LNDLAKLSIVKGYRRPIWRLKLILKATTGKINRHQGEALCAYRNPKGIDRFVVLPKEGD